MTAQYRVYTLLHIRTFLFRLIGIGVNRMMPYDYHPILFRIGKGFIEPLQLSFIILLYGIGISFCIFSIFRN